MPVPSSLAPDRDTGTHRLPELDEAPAAPPPVSAPADAAAAPAVATAVRSWWDGRSAGGWLATGLAVVAAVVLTAGIRTPWPWSDEGATYLALQRDGEQLAVLWHSRDAPWVPYYYLAKVWATGLQAVFPGMPTLVAVRLLSATAAVATVVALYALVARNAGRLGGVLAALILLSLPGFDRYAQEARGYSLLALAATVSWLAGDQWLRPHNRATLTGSTLDPAPAHGTRLSARLGVSGRYAAALAATAAIHTFGLFQWPAHLVAVIAAPGSGTVRRRRLGSLLLVGFAAAVLAAAQLAASLRYGTGPANPQAARVVTPLSTLAQLARGISVVTVPAVSLPVVLLAVIGALSRVDGRRSFPASLLSWLAVPLALAITLGAVRTNLFRLRYWIAFLPPLAALAGLGVLALGTAVARRLGRLPNRGAGLARLGGTVVAVLALGLQAAAVVPPQVQLRAANGHVEDLGGVLAVLTEARAEHPGLIVAISAPTSTGMLAAVEPGLLTQDPLQQLDPAVPTVYTVASPPDTARRELAGVHEVLWIHRGPQPVADVARHLPRALARLHPVVIRAERAGPGWTTVLLETRS